MTPHERVRAHKTAGTIRHWWHDDYLPYTVCVFAEIDRSGKGRFERTEVYGQTLAMALADLVGICDALPGGHRAYRAEGRAA